MMRQYYLIVLMILVAFHGRLLSQQTLSGRVFDFKSKEYLVGATIMALPSQIGTTTDVNGIFTLYASKSVDTLVVSYIGYMNDTVVIRDDNRSSFFQIMLKNQVGNLQTVTVTAQRGEALSPVSVISIKGSDAYLIPAAFGTPDVFKFLQTKPGILTAGEGTSNLIVRGGSPDQNLILLDGNPIYYPNHLGGFVSVFNTDAIADLKLYKGYKPSLYGGRLSSVIDIRTTRNMADSTKYGFEVGPIISKFQLSTPIKKGKASIFLTGRRSLLDILYRSVQKLTKNPDIVTYGMGDFNAKLNWEIGQNRTISYGAYYSYDRLLLSFEEKDETGTYSSRNAVKWSNLVNYLDYRHFLNSTLFEVSLGLSKFDYGTSSIDSSTNTNSGETRKDELMVASGITDAYGKISISRRIRAMNISTGINGILHMHQPQIRSIVSDGSPGREDNDEVQSKELIHYLQIGYMVGKYKIDGGVHSAFFTTDGLSKLYPQLRMNISKEVGHSTFASFSIGKMVQFSHLLSTNGSGLPTDIWIPSTLKSPPAESWQFDFGLSHAISNNHSFELGAYHKQMRNLVDYKDGVSVRSGRNFEELIASGGKGRSYGLEFEYQFTARKNNLSLAYTLSRSFRQFNSINNGAEYPYRYDRPHSLSIVYNRFFNPRVQFDAFFTLYSGEALTLAQETFDIFAFDYGFDFSFVPSYGPHDAHYYGGRNAFRAPLYHRLDWQITLLKEKERFKRYWRFGITNTYNRINSYFLYYEKDRQTNVNTLHKFGLFPLIPFLNYSLVMK